MPDSALSAWAKPMPDMTTEKKGPGRKPGLKSWDTKFCHAIRTDYKDDTDLHVLLFLAGDRTSELIHAALRDFAKSHAIPIDDPVFQSDIAACAGTVIAKTKRSPFAAEVMQYTGKSNVLAKLMRCIDGSEAPVENLGYQNRPRVTTSPPPPPLTPIQAREAPPAAAARQVRETPVEPNVQQQVRIPTPRELPEKASPSAVMEVEPELELGAGEIDPAGSAQSLKNRWLSGHDY